MKPEITLLQIHQLSPSAKTILLYARFYHHDHSAPLPSGRRIGKFFGWSDSTTYRAIDQLIEIGLLKTRGDGTRRFVFVNPRIFPDKTLKECEKIEKEADEWYRIQTSPDLCLE